MVEAFSAICVDRKLKSFLCNKRKPCQSELLGPAQCNDCTTKTAGGGSLRRLRSVVNVSSNKGTISRQFRGPSSPSHRQLCLPAGVRPRLGRPQRRCRAGGRAKGKGRRGKQLGAAAAVSCILSVPLGEVGVLQLRYLQPTNRGET